MKLTKILLLAVTLSCFACGSDDEAVVEPTPTTQGCDSTEACVVAKIGDDDNFKASTIIAIKLEDVINIQAVEGLGTALNIAFPSTGLGSFDVDDGVVGAYQQSLLSLPFGSTEVGSVTLTAMDTQNKTVEGTFSFTGENADGSSTLSVTEGAFYVTYTE